MSEVDPIGAMRRGWDEAELAEAAERKSWASPSMRAAYDAFGALLADRVWNHIEYCPKDGSWFLAWDCCDPLPYRCQYEGEWPNGHWWKSACGDLWPARPQLWKPLPT
jgi:hypothetical protein